jgi:biopolymer transport protein ExbD
VRWTNGKAFIIFENNTYENLEPLVEKLKGRHNANAKYRVVIRGDKRLPAIEIQRVMSVVAQAGIDDISFSALNKE